jgi:outer membrane lipoprotein-sorting protein
MARISASLRREIATAGSYVRSGGLRAETVMAEHNIAWSGALAAVLVCLIAVPAFAQGVPLPTPRPLLQRITPKTTGAIALPAKPAASRQALGAHAQMAQAPGPVNNPFAELLGKASPTGAMTAEQRAVIDRVNNYLSGIQVLSGRFVQVGPDGRRSEGDFFIAKPGRIRFEYDDPSPIELIADGQSMVVRDRRLATQDVYPLSQTPLRFLLADHVDLMKDTHLLSVYVDDMFVTVVVEERNGIVGTSRLMIMFSANDMQLKQWTVTDPQGYDTTVAVYNLDTTKRPDPNMFKIDYTNYRN